MSIKKGLVDGMVQGTIENMVEGTVNDTYLRHYWCVVSLCTVTSLRDQLSPVQCDWWLSAHDDRVAFVELDLDRTCDVSLGEIYTVHYQLHLGCVPEPIVTEARELCTQSVSDAHNLLLDVCMSRVRCYRCEVCSVVSDMTYAVRILLLESWCGLSSLCVILCVSHLSVHGDALKVKVSLSEHGARWCLVDTSRFDAYKTVLNYVDATHTVGSWG